MFMNIPFILLQCATFFYLISTGGYFCYLFYQKDRIQQTALGAVGIGAVVHLFAIVLQSAALGGLPIYTIGQSLSMAGLSLAAMFIYVQYRFYLKILGVYATAMISVLMLAAILLPDFETREL